MTSFVRDVNGDLRYTVDTHTWIIKFEEDEEEYNCFDDKGNEEQFDNLEEAIMWCREPEEEEEESDSD
jgi:hypothetical protein